MKALLPIAITASLGALAAISPGAIATDSQPRTLAGCAELLPAGQSYTYQVSGTIDLTTGKPVLTGTFAVQDATTVDRRSANEAFGRCVAALIGA